MSKKQSSIEYLGYELNTKLFYNISPELWDEVNKIFEQAKAMHRKEIEDAYGHGQNNGYMYANQRAISINIADFSMNKANYFNQTFGGQDNE